MVADMLGAPHQDRDPVAVGDHAAIDADIHDAGFGILGDAAAIGEEIAPAVEPVPMRRGKLVEIDVGALEDVLLHRSGVDDLGGMLPARMVRPILTSSRGCVSGGSPSIMAMRR